MIPFFIGFPSFLSAYIRSRNNRSLGTTHRLQKFSLPAIAPAHSGL